MKNRFLALFCAFLLTVGAAVPGASALEGEASRAADALTALGLLDQTPELDAVPTRAEAALLLVRLAGAEHDALTAGGGSFFHDISARYHPASTYAGRQGWFTAADGQDFRPYGAVTADVWYAALLRMLGYSDRDGDFHPDSAAAFARHIGLTPLSDVGELTWDRLCQSAASALTFPRRDSGATVIQTLVEKGLCPRATANALGLLTAELTMRQTADRLSAAAFGLATYESLEEIATDAPTGAGSGFFISSDGLAVTNYHCIAGSLAADVVLATGEVFPVETVVWYDVGMDLAVLRVSRTPDGRPPVSSFAHLQLAGTKDLRAGDRVYTIGNPLGLGLAVSEGVVSAVSRPVERYAQPCVMSTADISQGSSGGALLNVYGHVIAVTSGAFRDGNAMFLSVPVDPLLTADLSAPGLTLAEVAAKEAG